MNGFLKQISLWIVLIIIIILLLTHYSTTDRAREELTRRDFVEQLNAGNVQSLTITIAGDNFYKYHAKLKELVNGQNEVQFEYHEVPDEWEALLDSKEVEWNVKREDTMLMTVLINIVPLVLIFGLIWFFMFRQMQGGNNKALSFGKSRARLVNHSDKVVTFEDVAGVDEAKEELQEIIEFLKDPKKFSRLGGKIP
ncbi:MAG: ATP-dependent metallopeptidase FtsH/Yme1/Tma family protein, partial [Candidatus Hydrogenedentes bacterium]|nr:ATP-dependent metallopeptidase FtsH/Yme1/Tma family protein [Candidatus Hydrogenedentota bacterium]